MGILIEARDLRVGYGVGEKVLWAVDRVSFSIEEGEIFGVLGESGCGKTTLALSFLKLLPAETKLEGKLLFESRNVLELQEEDLRRLRGKEIGIIFQEPITSLNPIMRIKEHFLDTIRAHFDILEDEALNIASSTLNAIGIPSSILNFYPFELSHEQAQRVLIALALALKPKLLIIDEPTNALDIVDQAGFLKLIVSLRKSFKLTIVLMTRDLGVVAQTTDRVMVMYAGEVIEIAPTRELFGAPLHPYFKALLFSAPNLDLEDFELRSLEGFPSDPLNPPKGCRFHPRCFEAMDICGMKEPKVYKVSKSRLVKCWKYHG